MWCVGGVEGVVWCVGGGVGFMCVCVCGCVCVWMCVDVCVTDTCALLYVNVFGGWRVVGWVV